MKLAWVLIFVFSTLLTTAKVEAGDVKVWQEKIQVVNLNVRGNPVVIHDMDITVSQPGTVLVELEGYTISSPGDQIVMAASNNNDWSGNDGNVSTNAFNSDQNRRTVAHSRSYDIQQGNHTFYAIAENFIATDGTGIISFYGSLTVKFYPTPALDSDPLLITDGIVLTNVQTEGDSQVLSQIDMFAPVPGTVLVRFSGHGYADVGDRQLLAASNTPDWSVNEGHIAVEALDNNIRNESFSHSQLYDVAAGNHSFYAVGNNFVETAGDGFLSVYGMLSVEFMPHINPQVSASQEPIVAINVDMGNGVVSLADISKFETVRGQNLVRYDGNVYPDVGDRIVSAATNNGDWSGNSGQISSEIVNTDLNHSTISHSMLYPIIDHQNNFQAVGEVFVETAGDGFASSYSHLTVQTILDPDSIFFATFE